MLRVWSVGEERAISVRYRQSGVPPPAPRRRHAARSLPRQPDSHHATMNRGGAPSTAKPVTSNTQLGLLATVLVFLVCIYFQGWKVMIPVKYGGRMRGHESKYPISEYTRIQFRGWVVGLAVEK